MYGPQYRQKRRRLRRMATAEMLVTDLNIIVDMGTSQIWMLLLIIVFNSVTVFVNSVLDNFMEVALYKFLIIIIIIIILLLLLLLIFPFF